MYEGKPSERNEKTSYVCIYICMWCVCVSICVYYIYEYVVIVLYGTRGRFVCPVAAFWDVVLICTVAGTVSEVVL